MHELNWIVSMLAVINNIAYICSLYKDTDHNNIFQDKTNDIH